MCCHPKTVFIAGGLCLLVRLLSPASADGAPPLPAVVAEPIKQVPATDWQTDDKRLRLLIRETVKPKPVADKSLPADVEALLVWSKPVNGLVARID